MFLHLVIGEMLPKSLTLAGPEAAILILVWPQRLYVALFRPVIRVLNGLANAGVRLFGVEPKDDLATVASADEIAVMLANSRDEGVLAPSEHELLTGALDFGAREVASVMIPRDKVVTVRAVDPVRVIESVIVERGHSRLPVDRLGTRRRPRLHPRQGPPQAARRGTPPSRIRPSVCARC